MSHSKRRAAILAEAKGDRLTDKQYDAMVSRWNALLRHQRSAASQQCVDLGHDMIHVPFSTPDRPTKVCKRCLRYELED